VTGGPEGAWTNEPTRWDNGFLDNLLNYDYELTTSPAGAKQWRAKDPEAQDTVPDAHDPSKRHAPMLTTDLALKVDPVYAPTVKRFHENPDELADAFARAWYKLLHRDLGPVSRYLGPWVPEPQLWQDPVPAVGHDLVADEGITALKGKILASGLSVSQLASTAWAAAALGGLRVRRREGEVRP
jgi:catalase-peroxidase